MTPIGEVLGTPGQLAHPSCFKVHFSRCKPPALYQTSVQQRTRDVRRCARQGKKHLLRQKGHTGDPDSGGADVDSGQAAPTTSQPRYISSDPPGHRAGYVAIIGKPNAGKSTLLNAILGQKLSIVTPKAQTTRHRIIGVHSGPGFQCILLDTPGILRPVSQPEERNKLDEQMMRNVRRATRDAEAVLFLVDAGVRPEDAAPLLQPYCNKGLPVAVVLNKVDTVPEERERELVAYFGAEPGVDQVIPTSALKGRNVDAVERWAVAQLPLGPSLYPKDTVSEHPERFFVAEIIREKIFQQYREEVPYCTSVQVMDYKERKAGKDLVQVVVFVEQESQKGIILGKGASALKAMATAARADIEQFLGRSIYLDMSVKVKPKWRSDAEAVTGLGY